MTKFEQSFQKLKTYCEQENFKGWDPYDGLNSKVFQALPFISKNRFFRLAWIQFFKRSPINFRKHSAGEKRTQPERLGSFSEWLLQSL